MNSPTTFPRLPRDPSRQLPLEQKKAAPPPAPLASSTTVKLASNGMPEALCRLPLFRPVATKLMQLLADEEVQINKLSQFIQSDPGFSAEVLQIANSPVYGFAAKISSISHALVVLGLERTRTLAMTIAMRAYLKSTQNHPVVKQFWRHALASAQLCEEFGPLFSVPRDRAYTAGLMHDIGRLGLLATYPKEYAAIADKVYLALPAVLEAERETFGVNHCQAGFWLAKTWGFPLELCEGVAEHHKDVPLEPNSMASLVRFTCRLATSMDFCTIRCTEVPSPDDIIAQLPEILRMRIPWNEAEVRERVDARVAALATP